MTDLIWVAIITGCINIILDIINSRRMTELLKLSKKTSYAQGVSNGIIQEIRETEKKGEK